MKLFELFGSPTKRVSDLKTDFESAKDMRKYYESNWIRLPHRAPIELKACSRIVSGARDRARYPVFVDKFDVYFLGREQKWLCARTKTPLEFTEGGDYYGANPNVITMDRIDNNKPYTVNNIELVTWKFNRFKNSFPIEELVFFSSCVMDTYGIDYRA